MEEYITIPKIIPTKIVEIIHSISNKITLENDIIVTETLKINKMVQNKNLSKKIYDASWQLLIRQLEYKTKWRGESFYEVEMYDCEVIRPKFIFDFVLIHNECYNIDDWRRLLWKKNMEEILV